LRSLGISSLIAYAARTDFMIDPGASDPASARASRETDHPTQLHTAGSKCRHGIAEASRRPLFCHGRGPITLGNMCMPPLERLRSLFDMSSRGGATFNMSLLPSTGSLSVEEDREWIHNVEEDMRDIFVRMAILEQ
jgi:hypothetical protein